MASVTAASNGFGYLSDQVTEPGLCAGHSSARPRMKWLEPRSPTLDATLGVSVTEVGAPRLCFRVLLVVLSRGPSKRLCEPTSIGQNAQVRVCACYPGLAPVGTPYTTRMQITTATQRVFRLRAECVVLQRAELMLGQAQARSQLKVSTSESCLSRLDWTGLWRPTRRQAAPGPAAQGARRGAF